MAQAQMGSGAEIVVVVDSSAETTEVYFDDGNMGGEGICIGMTGDKDMSGHLQWLAHSAAQFHNIDYRREEVGRDTD